jgi:hypothetical protein
MRRFVLLASLIVLVAATLGLARPPIGWALASGSQGVTARLGISAGDAIADAPLGTNGDALRAMVPELWVNAQRLDVTIVSASVGQGFWSDDGELESENDLDLVVNGSRQAIEALAATLGRSWDQSTVYVWYPTQVGGAQATATIPLPFGASQLTAEIYAALEVELGGGAHVRYAGADSLIFIANTDETESDAAFFARVTRLVGALEALGVEPGPVERGRADVTVITRDDYERFIDDGVSVLSHPAA